MRFERRMRLLSEPGFPRFEMTSVLLWRGFVRAPERPPDGLLELGELLLAITDVGERDPHEDSSNSRSLTNGLGANSCSNLGGTRAWSRDRDGGCRPRGHRPGRRH